MNAREKLIAAQRRAGSLISAGIEPSPEYLPPGFAPTREGYAHFFRGLIEATHDLVSAYKPNLAFFEALGREGWKLLYQVREMIPDDAVVIADAKRGDIGSSARYYAQSLYEDLAADAATVNPLMGRDALEPFLQHADRLTFGLVLTSNPGAADFLLPNGTYRTIAKKLIDWGTPDNLGFVVGATREAEHLAELRELAPQTFFLVPGVGAQGGDLERTLRAGTISDGDTSGLVIHSTRGILPDREDAARDPFEVIREKTENLRAGIQSAFSGAKRTT